MQLGHSWTGTVTIYLFQKQIEEKEFDCSNLEILRTEVEGYVETFRLKLESIFK